MDLPPGCSIVQTGSVMQSHVCLPHPPFRTKSQHRVGATRCVAQEPPSEWPLGQVVRMLLFQGDSVLILRHVSGLPTRKKSRRAVPANEEPVCNSSTRVTLSFGPCSSTARAVLPLEQKGQPGALILDVKGRWDSEAQ